MPSQQQRRPPQQIPVTPAAARILNTVQNELFPQIGRLKDILVDVQRIRIGYQLFSISLNKIDERYWGVSNDFFTVVRRLQTPDILFEGMENIQQGEVVAAFFQFNQAIESNIKQGLNYVEIIDRALDRKAQTIQNNRTFLVSIGAIVLSIFSIGQPI